MSAPDAADILAQHHVGFLIPGACSCGTSPGTSWRAIAAHQAEALREAGVLREIDSEADQMAADFLALHDNLDPGSLDEVIRASATTADVARAHTDVLPWPLSQAVWRASQYLAERDAAQERITAALALHRPVNLGRLGVECSHDFDHYPCRTVRALTGDPS